RCCAQRLLPLRTPPSTSVTVLRPISCMQHLCPRSSTPQRQRDQIIGSLLIAGGFSTGRGMLSSSPIETGSSPDWHPAGLLTHASSNSRYLPGRFAKNPALAGVNPVALPSRFLRVYSCGAVPDFHRLPDHQMCKLYIRNSLPSQAKIVDFIGTISFTPDSAPIHSWLSRRWQPKVPNH